MLNLNKKLYKSIKEVASELEINESVLRYWETQFPQLSPIRRSGKRLYTNEDVQTAKKIQSLLHKDGLTIKGAKKALEDYQSSDVKEKISNILDYLKSLKDFLEKYIS